MKSYSRAHLSDESLLRELVERISQDRTSTADLLAVIGEIDERRLYLPAGYSSMFMYCVGKLHLSEDSTYKRIQAARAARKHPAIFDAVADGRLHLSAVVLLKPHLTHANVAELMAAATRKSKTQIKKLLAERFPQPDLPTRVRALPSRPAPLEQLVPEPVAPAPLAAAETEEGAARVEALAGAAAVMAGPAMTLAEESQRPTVSPLAPKRYALQLTMSQEMHDDLRRAQVLLSHRMPSGDEAQVLHRALKALITQLEKRKYAATDKPRKPRTSANPRHIPAYVKRAVEERDGGRCTFVSDTGQRCAERRFLEFDHVHEVARGGQATISNIRLRCRAHNQYAAECAYGAELMRRCRLGGRDDRHAASGWRVAAAVGHEEERQPPEIVPNPEQAEIVRSHRQPQAVRETEDHKETHPARAPMQAASHSRDGDQHGGVRERADRQDRCKWQQVHHATRAEPQPAQ